LSSHLFASPRLASVQVWRTTDARLVGVCRGHLGAIADVAVSPDDTLLASGDEIGIIELISVVHNVGCRLSLLDRRSAHLLSCLASLRARRCSIDCASLPESIDNLDRVRQDIIVVLTLALLTLCSVLC
jgi:WD40 repeat protein